MADYLYLLPYAIILGWTILGLCRFRGTEWKIWILSAMVLSFTARGASLFFESTWIAGTIIVVLLIVVLEYLNASADLTPADAPDWDTINKQS